MAYGYITMQNQDGTQYAYMAYGELQWSENRRDATPFMEEVFKAIESMQEQTRTRDCPDNGFFGIYNLEFTPIKKVR